MKTLLTSRIVLVTLALNLVLGNLILLVANHMDVSFMNVGLSLVCIAVLLFGFRRAAKLNKGWKALLLGLCCTLLIPLLDMFLAGLALSFSSGDSAGDALGKALVTGILFGAVGGWWFTPPFFLFNLPAFYFHWRAQPRL